MRKQYKIDVLYKKSLRARVRIFLLHMAEKAGRQSFDIGMDREQLARFLGVNRSALSHELSLMRSDGLIRFSKSKFELLPAFYTSYNDGAGGVNGTDASGANGIDANGANGANDADAGGAKDANDTKTRRGSKSKRDNKEVNSWD
jgi:hypothetical protein